MKRLTLSLFALITLGLATPATAWDYSRLMASLKTYASYARDSIANNSWANYFNPYKKEFIATSIFGGIVGTVGFYCWYKNKYNYPKDTPARRAEKEEIFRQLEKEYEQTSSPSNLTKKINAVPDRLITEGLNDIEPCVRPHLAQWTTEIQNCVGSKKKTLTRNGHTFTLIPTIRVGGPCDTLEVRITCDDNFSFRKKLTHPCPTEFQTLKMQSTQESH